MIETADMPGTNQSFSSIETRRLRRSARLPVLGENEYALRLGDVELECGVGFAQQSLRSARMRADVRVIVGHRSAEDRLDRFFAESDERAAQTELPLPIAATKQRGQFLGQVSLLPHGHEDDGGAPRAPGDLATFSDVKI